MARALTLILVLLAACGGRGLPGWKTSPTPGANVKRVDHLEQFTSTSAWRVSRYFHIEDDLGLPIYLIVAQDETACIVPALDWTIAERGDFYPCPRKWRVARPA